MTNLPVPSDSRNPFVFKFQDDSIRILQDDHGEPLFVATDICKAVKLANPSQVVSRLDDDEKSTIQIMDTDNRPRSLILVNESGLYSLILRSNKPEAKAFKRWITHEVLPSIRKTGSYSTQSLTPTQALLVAVQRMVDIEEEQTRQADAIRRIEARQDVQDQTREYMTIRGYANYIHRHIDNSAAATLGKRATQWCNAENIHIGKVKDPLYGYVKSYPDTVLKVIFDNWFSQMPMEIE